ncbi:MAG: mannosyltransferase family protein [Planctomycetota bacterium]
MTEPESTVPAQTPSPPAETNPPATAAVEVISWREPVLAWFMSRFICILAIILGGALFPIERTYDLRRANPNAGVQADLPAFFRSYAQGFRDLKRFGNKPMIGVSVGGREAWLRSFVHWDAIWWLSVAEVGYVADPQLKAEQNIVFYPLFPLLIRAVNLLGVPIVLASLLVVNGLMLLVTCLLYRLVVRRSGVAAARWTLAFWLAFPSAFFGVVPYSEALLAVLSVLAMQALLDQKYITSGLWCGLASALKNQGVIIGGALVVPFLTGPRRLRALIGLLCSGLGLLAYMGFLYYQYGDPFLFVTIQKAWRPKLGNPNPVHWFLGLVQATLRSMIMLLKSGNKPIDFYSGRILDPWLGWWVILWLPAVRRLHWGLVLSSAVMILLPLSTGTVASLGRYVWIILPIFVVMGERLAHSKWRWPIVLASTCGLLWQAFLYGGGWEVI